MNAIPVTEYAIYVAINEQKLYLFKASICAKIYDCRLSGKPPSCVENSFGTPLGLHRVEQKIGAAAPWGMVFKGRKPTGIVFCETAPSADNLVTTRILWLGGLEPGVNSGPGCDSYQRYIYIHGTNHEADFERARSHGCVLLRNDDVIELFERIPAQSLVYIGE